MVCRREWCARLAGAGAALALAWWCARGPLPVALQVVGALAVARAGARLCALWLAPALPARRLQGPGLARRAVLVTGCDSGFGHAAALRLHALGARVFAGVLLPHGPGARALRLLASARMRVLPLDVTDARAVAAAARAVTHELSDSGEELQAIVNNAGILSLGESEFMDVEELRKTLDVNVIGQVKVTQAFLPLIRKFKGRIVNVNSIAGRVPFTMLNPYTISKHASVAFTEGLIMDMKKFSVSVHSIEPGLYMTPMTQRYKSLFTKGLEAIPEEILNAYGNRYKEKSMKLLDLGVKVLSSPSSKILEVTEAIEDACFSEDPQEFYYPGGTTKLLLCLKEEIKNLQTFFIKLIFNLWKINVISNIIYRSN